MLGYLECRVFEELWALEAMDELKVAAGELQGGFGDSMVENATSMNTHGIRKSLQLPSGDIFVDRREAFDRKTREEILMAIAEAKNISPRLWLMARAAIQGSTLRVVFRGQLSTTISPQVGVQEGRKLSPDLYCAGAKPVMDET